MKTDVLIIGAGPSGTASAAILKKEGFNVTIVEKTTFPRFVIGESLLPRCMDLLEEADLLETIKKQDYKEKHGAKFYRGDDTCEFNFGEQYTKGQTWTWQVPRADFDKVLADEVEKKGVYILYNSAVENVEFTTDKVLTTINTKGKIKTIESKYIIDGSGYGRVLPNLLDLNIPSTLPVRSAFFTHIDDTNRAEDIESSRIQVVVLKADVWVWIIPFSNGKTSLGVVGDLSFIDKTKSNDENFRDLLQSNEFLSPRFGNNKFEFEPKVIDGYSAGIKQLYGDKYVLTGNSTEFLDPIFSSGVTFALESGVLAAKLVIKELNNEKVDWEKEYSEYILKGVAVFRSYVDRWYDETLQTVFFSDEIGQKIKGQICSVLAGYVWEDTNPFIKKHKRIVQTLAKVIEIKKG